MTSETYAVKLFVLFSVLGVHGWDQIQPKTFRAIFPYANQSDVWKLSFDVNHQNSTDTSRNVVNQWLAEKWVQIEQPPSTNESAEKYYISGVDDSWFLEVKTPEPAWEYRHLSDKEFARKQSITFVDHRGTVKMLIRFFYRTLQQLGYFTEAEAREMRQLFWASDTECNNYFRCTGPSFLNKTKHHFANGRRNSSDIERVLVLYGSRFATDFPPNAERLNWKLEGGKENVPRGYYPTNNDWMFGTASE